MERTQHEKEVQLLAKFWKKSGPLQSNYLFYWQMFQNSVPTYQNLLSNSVIVDIIVVHCVYFVEIRSNLYSHLFVTFAFACHRWYNVCRRLGRELVRSKMETRSRMVSMLVDKGQRA